MQKIYPAVDIECDIPQDMQPLELDRDDMLELLGNLLDNACKFSIHKVALAATVRTAFFHLEIEDDGPGVNSDQFSHIIEQGVRLDESVKGHGLGLSICSDIVTGYRGTIAFTSSRFGGLKVIVDMPLERAN